MSLNKPFHRIVRELVSAPNAGYSGWAYIIDKNYSKFPYQYTRAYLLIQEDILKLFEYIEPSDLNLKTYSHRIHELLVRICIEVEANFKAILRENIYTPIFKTGKRENTSRTEEFWKMDDYKRINKSHHLDNYFIELPMWKGEKYRYCPFGEWSNGGTLTWYQAYNECKHDRAEKLELANFENLIHAFTGLFALLSSQFKDQSFTPGGSVLTDGDEGYFNGKFGIGDYLKIEFPKNWTVEEKYDFNWSILKYQSSRFEKYNYNDTI